MLLFYLDTSALQKRYKTEKGTNVIDGLFSARVEGEVFVTSHLTTVEVESAASRALKGRVLNKKAYGVLLDEDAMALLSVLRKHPEEDNESG